MSAGNRSQEVRVRDTGIAIEKFEEMIDLAERAESRFEKAAVFGATCALAERLVGEDGQRLGRIDAVPAFLEAVEEARYCICAFVGYGPGDPRYPSQRDRHHLERARLRVGEMRHAMPMSAFIPSRMTHRAPWKPSATN